MKIEDISEWLESYNDKAKIKAYFSIRQANVKQNSLPKAEKYEKSAL